MVVLSARERARRVDAADTPIIGAGTSPYVVARGFPAETVSMAGYQSEPTNSCGTTVQYPCATRSSTPRRASRASCDSGEAYTGRASLVRKVRSGAAASAAGTPVVWVPGCATTDLEILEEYRKPIL